MMNHRTYGYLWIKEISNNEKIIDCFCSGQVIFSILSIIENEIY
jgi:hypothetical protein